jgi:hypothetical protein
MRVRRCLPSPVAFGDTLSRFAGEGARRPSSVCYGERATPSARASSAPLMPVL